MDKCFQTCTAQYTLLLTGDYPEVSSNGWCSMMTDNQKSGWTANDAKRCLL